MSTRYEPIDGLLEVPNPATSQSYYLPSELYVKRFYGGIHRGVSIQLTIVDEYGDKFIQLNNTSANQLLELLRDALSHVDQNGK